MMTPQEVSEHSFPKASFGGYNMASVDEFLDQLTVDYTSLYKENATLKAKMKVLADSLEEYRATEKGMRRALLTAQQTADEMVAEAERTKAQLVQSAENEAKATIEHLNRQVADEEARLNAAKKATANYVSQVRKAIEQQQEVLLLLDDMVDRNQDIGTTVQDIDASIQRLIHQEDQEYAQEQELEEEAEQPVLEFADEILPKSPKEEPPEPEAEPEPQPEPIPEPEPAQEAEPEAEPEAAPQSAPEAEPSQEKPNFDRRNQERSGSFEDIPEEHVSSDTAPTRRIDFDHLQFGSNYDPK